MGRGEKKVRGKLDLTLMILPTKRARNFTVISDEVVLETSEGFTRWLGVLTKTLESAYH